MMALKTQGTLLIIIWSFMQMTHVIASGQPSSSYVEVQTQSGTIRGLNSDVSLSTGSVKVTQFLGIPYAKPPVGERRFARPKMIGAWDETYDAIDLPNSCPQVRDTMFGDFEGSQMWNANTNISEDCLYLNVWTPNIESKEPLAVMVWIFGGGFTSGSATLDLYNGQILAVTGNIVVVSMQYRVGALGFLYLDIPGAPGNMGLIDQAVALKWISQNIHSFGGDKNRITLFGESAGAGSCSLHTLSPLSQPLINSVILQSGSSLSVWAVNEPDFSLSQGKELAHLLGCYGDSDEMLKCLKTQDPIDISEKQFQVHSKPPVTIPFGPTIDKYFIQDTPINLMNSGHEKKIKTLLGMNKNEGSYFLIYEGHITKNNEISISEQEYKNIVKSIINEQNQDLHNLIAYEYESDSYDNFPNYVASLDSLLGDVTFSCAIVELAEMNAEKGSDVFLYYFTHRTSANPWPEWTGVMHGYEIDHVFGAPLNMSLHVYNETEQQLSRQMITYWSNFAKSGNPNYGEDANNTVRGINLPVWPKYTTQEKSALQLKTGKLEVIYGPRERKCRFWREIYPALRDTLSSYKMDSGASGILFCVCYHWTRMLLLFVVLFSL